MAAGLWIELRARIGEVHAEGVEDDGAVGQPERMGGGVAVRAVVLGHVPDAPFLRPRPTAVQRSSDV